MSRKNAYRRRKKSLVGPLLSFAVLGATAAATAALVVAYRRGHLRGFLGPDPDFDPGRIGGELFPPAPRLQDLALWLPGPAGNLFVRDGGAGGAHDLPLLFVHGLGGNGGQWVLQLDAFRPERRAIALDLRGHGESDPAADGDYSVPALASDIAAVADQLHLRRFVLIGHSLGALPAIAYAAAHPDRVAALVLVDPNGDQTRLPRAEINAFLDAVRRDPLPETESYFRQLVVGGDRNAAAWILEDLAQTEPQAIVGALEGAATWSPLAPLAAYPGPKIALVSELNSLPISLHRLDEDLPVRPVGGTGHWIQLDRPEAVEHALDELLEAIEP
ncbi:MAG TPA: alpha/beta fold hydrolase [Thermoanaerobaculia bacterium]|jgi:pimeloyl-ACP methyl ester carboxylesterase|nr:alpha/beta fold hydrolase [Thermoanaerobaculia bacterium]